MTDDFRPLFDDEDLPAWLKKGGITFRGKSAAQFTGSRVGFDASPWAATREDELLPAEDVRIPNWMQTDGGLSAPDEIALPSVEVPDWMQSSDPSPIPPEPVAPPRTPSRPSAAVTPSKPSAPPIPSKPSAPSAKTEVIPPEDDLSWRGEKTSGKTEVIPPENDLSWLDEPPATPEPAHSQPIPPVIDDDLRSLFDPGDQLLDGFDSERDFDPGLPEPVDAQGNPPDIQLDWLDTLPPPSSPVESLKSEDLPGWAGAVSSTPSPDVSSSSWDEPVPSTDSDLPEWMRDLPAPAPAAPEPVISQPTAGTDMDWLNAISGPEEPVSAAPASGDLPDWLRGVTPTGTEPEDTAETLFTPPAPAPAEETYTSSDIDALLSLPIPEQRSKPNLPAISEPALPAVPVNRAEDDISFDDTTLDDLLGPAPETAPEAGTFKPSVPEPPPSSGMMRGLLKSQSLGVRKLPAQPAEEQPPEDIPAPMGELPEFVQDMRPADAPIEFNIGGVQVGVREEPLSSLPDQLRQLRDRSKELKQSKSTAEESPAEGALAEIEGVLSTVDLAVQPTSTAPVAAATVMTDMQAARVRIIQSILEIEEEAEGTRTRKRVRRRLKLDRLFIAVVLWAVIALPFITDKASIMIPPDTTNPTTAQRDIWGAIDRLPPGNPVLVAFEYGPAGSGELDDLARVILRDLFRKGARPVIVSTNPAGALHAESLLAVMGANPAELTALNRADQPLVARKDYVVLRYLPAGAAGVRSVLNGLYLGGFEAQTQFSTDIEGKASGLDDASLAALRNFPVVLLAETPDDIRNWAEQYTAASTQKIILAVSAAADATARAYVQTRHDSFYGPLVGLRDATAYRVMRQTPPQNEVTLLSQRWQSTGLGALAAGIIILLGTLFSMIGALRRKPAQEKKR